MSTTFDAKLAEEQIDIASAYVKGSKPSLLPEASGRCRIEDTASGFPTLWCDARALHSRHHPKKEAERQAAAIKPTDANSLVVFFGGGLAYALQTFLEEQANPCLWLECDAEIFHYALGCQDFRSNLRSGRLRIVLGDPSEDTLNEVFRGRGNKAVMFVAHRASFALSPAYEKQRKQCEDFLNRKDVNLATITRFDRLWARNICKNYVRLMRARPVSLLFDSCRNGRAIVCGAGPSLAESLDRIHALREDAVLIAVDTALRTLQLSGLEPDIIVMVDPQPVNRSFFEGYEGDAIVVSDPTSSYHAMRLIKADSLFFTASPFPLASLLFSCFEVEPGEIAFGGSVSTNAYDLAVKLGCCEIILFGQDLAFSGGLAHVRGAVLEERLNYRESRFFRRELHNYRQLSALPVRKLPSLQGGEVATNDKLLIFHRWLSRRIAVDIAGGLRVLNFTYAGARIPHVPDLYNGGEKLDLSESQISSEKSCSELLKTAAQKNTMFRTEDFLRDLQKAISDLADFEILITEGEKLARDIYRMAASDDTKHAEYSQALVRATQMDEKIRSRMKLSQMLGSSMQNIILQITEDYGSAMDEVDSTDPDRKTARQSLMLYEGMNEACKRMQTELGRALRLCRLKDVRDR